VHFATNELDGGPVILQASVSVHREDNAASLAARVLEKEHIIYPLSVHWFCEGRVTMRNGQVEIDGQSLNEPLMLDELEIT
jgi:phosphoribosylglycinamide formyltransferase-1